MKIIAASQPLLQALTTIFLLQEMTWKTEESKLTAEMRDAVQKYYYPRSKFCLNARTFKRDARGPYRRERARNIIQ